MATPTPLHSTPGGFVRLAQELPPKLLRFFARFPPGTHTDVRSNPFKPTVHTVTGKWHNPVYSLRRQADLFKMARAYGVEELLPPSRKSSQWKAERLTQREIKLGQGIGSPMKKMLSPKGHIWERTLHARLEERRKAMEKMPALIEKWKRSGHGIGWKDWPR